MASLITRSVVLSFSRFSNYAILLFSPVLLVRILEVEQYGQYREFVLYATLFTAIIGFSVNRSLLYFVPKYPHQERVYVSQSLLIVGILSVISLCLIWLGRGWIVSATSFDFVLPLLLYLFFFINFDYLERYWIAKKRSDYVLYYSTGKLIVRMTAVVVVAWVTRDVHTIIASIVLVEVARFGFVMFYTLSRRLLVGGMSMGTLRYQMSYFVPLGIAAIVVALGTQAGKLIVSTKLGVAALAFYVVGTYTMPIVRVLRGAVSDVIFPEIMSKRIADPRKALSLWQRSTVVYCFLLFPLAVVLFYYADVFIVTLFTAEYVQAVPIFMIYISLMLSYCFDFHLPLRMVNKNVQFLIGNAVSLAVNLILLWLLFSWLGFIGPAIAYVSAEILLSAYMGVQMARIYSLSIGEILPWGQIGKVFVAAAICVPVLAAGELIALPEVGRALIFAFLYFMVYYLLIRRLGIEDIGTLVHRIADRMKRVARRAIRVA